MEALFGAHFERVIRVRPFDINVNVPNLNL